MIKIFSLVLVMAVVSSSADARRYHARHHGRHHINTWRTVYDPPRVGVAIDTSGIASSWPYVYQEIIYPNATGTVVLDELSGRVPVIGPRSCAYDYSTWWPNRPPNSWAAFN